jgi:hypothetical protein
MPPKSRKRSNLVDDAVSEKSGRAFFSIAVNEDCTSPLAKGRVKDRPATWKQSLETARGWASGKNGFIQMITRLRLAFFNYDFQVQPAGAVEADSAEAKKFKTWYQANEAALKSYARGAWLEWLTTDNVVALWATGQPVFAVRPEECEYRDKFAIETLTYTHGISREEAEKMVALTAAQRKALAENAQLTLTKKDDALFGFEVLKRSAVGDGFSWPSMQSAFLGASTHESLEVADSQLAGLMRRVYERHRKGHETRFGINSGGKANNLTDAYREKFLKGIKGKRGALELIVNWDHEIDWPRPDPKHFDARRYEAAIASLKQWALPLGHMLLATTINPYLLVFFAELANLEREYMASHLGNVFRRTLKPPGAIQCTWGDACFFDPRLRFDMLKMALTAGPLSQETFLQRIGEKPEVERQRKTAEAKLPKKQTRPLYDPAHGEPDQGGRKAGTGDNKAGD